MNLSLILQFCIFAIVSYGLATQQVRHDRTFQPDHILRVSEEHKAIACRIKAVAVVNGTTPGPAIHIPENKTSWVRVYNDFTSDNLTMHWHGLSQSVSPYSDGTPQASQWPIKAGHFFDYELHPNIGEAGTYLYHSHVDFQAVSVTGSLIVDEQDGKAPYEYDEERTIFITEVFNKTDRMLLDGLRAPLENFSWSGEAAAILVNGHSYQSLGANKTLTDHPWSASGPLANGTCRPEIINVKPNKTYRFRTIAGVALSPLVFALEDHDNLTVIAADGKYTQPAQTNKIQIGSGQRYDFILRTKTENELQRLGKSLFWIQLETRYRQQNNTFYALISYDTDSDTNQTIPNAPPTMKPIDIPYSIQTWMEYTLEPLQDNDFPTADQVTRQVFLSSAQYLTQSGIFWTIDNRTWTEEDERQNGRAFNDTRFTNNAPYLVEVYEEGSKAIPNYENAVQHHGGWDPQLNVYTAKVGEIIDIVLINEPNGIAGGFDTHPWHIHGDHVYDLGSGRGTYNATENEIKLQGYRPVLRDTSFLYKYTAGDDAVAADAYTDQGWRAWRLRVTNPGVWMVHCHTLHHMILGMQTVWIMGNSSQITRGVPTDLVEGYLTYGGNAYGNSTYDPLVTHFFDA